MTHNPVECAKCGRGNHVRPSGSTVFSYFMCCKTAAPKAKPIDEKFDIELAAARADKRQMALSL